MSKVEVIERLGPVFDRVKKQIKDHLSTDVPYVMEVAEHILFSGGKHLRPVLFVLSAQLCGYREDKEYYYSSVFEYLHAATLLHDDVIDQAETRRRRKAAHLIYGNPGVILVGDFLLAKSMFLGAETGLVQFFDTMAQTVGRMAEGEVLQLLHAGDPDITEEEYEKVIYRKTATLIESACYLGAALAEAASVQAQALRAYGRKIGLAFQVVDDCLDYSAEESEFGKPVGHDLDEGKVTLPLIKTLKRAKESDRVELADLIRKEERTPEEFTRIKDLMDQYNGLEQAYERAAQLAEEGQAALDIFPDCPQKTDLLELADFIVSRRY